MNGCIYRTKNNRCELWTDSRHQSFCDYENCENRYPSNGDRLRAMSDEELDDFLSYICDAYYTPYGGWLKWLRLEALDKISISQRAEQEDG